MSKCLTNSKVGSAPTRPAFDINIHTSSCQLSFPHKPRSWQLTWAKQLIKHEKYFSNCQASNPKPLVPNPNQVPISSRTIFCKFLIPHQSSPFETVFCPPTFAASFAICGVSFDGRKTLTISIGSVISSLTRTYCFPRVSVGLIKYH